MRVLRAATTAALLLAAAAALFVGWTLIVWPPPSWWRTHWPSETAFMRMRQRQHAAARDATPRHYRPVPLDSISDWLQRAATAGEGDALFPHHRSDYPAPPEGPGDPPPPL